MYAIKEIFYTLQGEGAKAGTPAVFCRFTGCNLWSGREEDRATAQCRFCDTDFVGADGVRGRPSATGEPLAAKCREAAGESGATLVVLTGGEPMLQVDAALIDALHGAGFEIAIETNGTLPVPGAIDWVCVSPKAGTTLAQRTGDELKLVYPQDGLDPGSLRGLAFTHLFLQPMDGPVQRENTSAAVAYCKSHPEWRLSLQTHKLLGIP